jgi:dTDP-4-amino-4,6-dideoxygalactose transaminase
MNEIKFLDLKKEILPIKDKINDKINEIFFNKTNFIMGNDVEDFENNFSNFINTKYCISVANGTDALEIALNSLKLNEDDEVITQANTYVATCLGITNNNLKLKIVDIDPDTYQIDLDLLEKSITDKTKVILVVHLTGSCCNMDKLMDIVIKNNLILVEDCAQSHGALYNNKKLGTYGLLSTFSFYPGKNLGAFGDGGAICTNNKDLYDYIRSYRNNGSIIKYKHEIIGRNSRLDTIHAAILDIKLVNLDLNNSKRRENAYIYNNLLKDIDGIEIPKIEEKCYPVYHLYIIKTEYRDALQEYLKKNKIQTAVHYPTSIYELECYKDQLKSSLYPSNSISNSTKILSLPMYPGLTKEEIKIVCTNIVNFFNVI